MQLKIKEIRDKLLSSSGLHSYQYVCRHPYMYSCSYNIKEKLGIDNTDKLRDNTYNSFRLIFNKIYKRVIQISYNTVK